MEKRERKKEYWERGGKRRPMWNKRKKMQDREKDVREWRRRTHVKERNKFKTLVSKTESSLELMYFAKRHEPESAMIY